MKTQKDRTLEWLDKRLESIERDIMYNVHLIKDKRYERGAIAALKDLSKAHTACKDSIIAVKHMYEELEGKETNKTTHITYGEDGSFYLGVSEKEYKIKGE